MIHIRNVVVALLLCVLWSQTGEQRAAATDAGCSEVAVEGHCLSAAAAKGGFTDEQQRFLDELSPKPSSEVAALESRVSANRDDAEHLVSQLKAIALDASRTNEDRRLAILTMGRLGNLGDADFLAKHIDLNVPVGVIKGDWDMIKQWPCYLALGSARWNAVPAVLGRLRHERSELALIFSADLLRQTLAANAATALVNEQQAAAESELHRKNLQRLLEMLSSP